jgi:hypothetical protein
VRVVGMDDMWVSSTFFFKSHSCVTKRSSAFPAAGFPQLTAHSSFCKSHSPTKHTLSISNALEPVALLEIVAFMMFCE